MIPEAETTLTPIEQERWKFTRLAYALAQYGVPVESIVSDAREGAERGAVVFAREVLA